MDLQPEMNGDLTGTGNPAEGRMTVDESDVIPLQEQTEETTLSEGKEIQQVIVPAAIVNDLVPAIASGKYMVFTCFINDAGQVQWRWSPHDFPRAALATCVKVLANELL